jgi:hypothetical protein
MELIKKFSQEQYEKALESWRWLVPEDAIPLLASSFGDIFFAYRGMVFYLDLVNGAFDLVAESMEDLENLLKSKDGQENYLMATLSITMQKQGYSLAPDQVFDFKTTPRLGGEISLENIQVMDFVSAVNVAGQIHQQIKDLPPGTRIDDVNIIDE